MVRITLRSKLRAMACQSFSVILKFAYLFFSFSIGLFLFIAKAVIYWNLSLTF